MDQPVPESGDESAVPLLGQAADLHGIEAEYWDIWGAHHQTSPAVQTAILRSLGVPCQTPDELQSHLAIRRKEPWARPIPRTLVVASDRTSPLRLPIRLPADQAASEIEIRIHCEDGTSRRQIHALADRDIDQRHADGTVEYHQKHVLLPDLPWGYHHLVLRSPAGHIYEARLIVTPAAAWVPEHLETGRIAGLAISLYGVRSERNWGAGDFTDLSNLLAWVNEDVHCSFLALNPLHSIDNRQPYNISPYLPKSALFRNPLYLDIDSIPEIQRSPLAQRILASPGFQQQLADLRHAEFVEYEAVWKRKDFFLRLAYRQFLREADPARQSAFLEFCAAQGDKLDKYATHCALWDWLHRRDPNLWIWPHWPAAYQDPESPEVRDFAQHHARRVRYHAFVQWLVDLQLEAVQQRSAELGLSVGLYHDLALAVDKCGADLWAYRDQYVAGCRVGSPPDGFAPEGQDWAFPPPNVDKWRDDGYRLFIDCIRANSRHGGALRIDHVMRLFRLYWIPDGMEAKNGAYVRDHYQDLLRILALESHRNRFFIVGEDLGTVADHIRHELERHRILSYKVFYFEKRPDGQFRTPAEYDRQALVSSTTHDLPTLAGFWTNRDIEARRAAGLLPDDASYQRQLSERRVDKQRMLDMLHQQGLLPNWYARSAEAIPELTGELHNAVIGFLVRTPSMVLVLNQEDLTKESEQQNLPASTYQYPNWRRKMKYTVEELHAHPACRDFTAMFRHWLTQTGRALP
ncbi:MAG: 4-alpha-glucanotransferase [Bryobacterales bacterium]|nr:4-alpha-glucanotransferase [Bryobacterales bacterium]